MPGGPIPRSADQQAKEQLRSFLRLIDPDGGTDPRTAMKQALSLRPDAVFLLSDGAFPDGTVAEITRFNRNKVPIHCIDLTGGLAGDHLKRIAAANNGQYASSAWATSRPGPELDEGDILIHEIGIGCLGNLREATRAISPYRCRPRVKRSLESSGHNGRPLPKPSPSETYLAPNIDRRDDLNFSLPRTPKSSPRNKNVPFITPRFSRSRSRNHFGGFVVLGDKPLRSGQPPGFLEQFRRSSGSTVAIRTRIHG